MMFSAWRIGHSSRNTGEKPAICGVTMQLGSLSSGSWDSMGSISVTSERRGFQLARFECLRERLAVDDRSASRVHQDRRGFQLAERIGVEKVPGLGGGRAVDGDVVAALENLLELDHPNAVEIARRLFHVGIVGDDLRRPEAADSSRERASDIAEADDADDVARDAADRVHVVAGGAWVLAPLTLARRGDRIVQAASYRQQHGDRVIRDLGGVNARHVAGQHAEFGGGIEVDGIHPDTESAHHLELRAGPPSPLGLSAA